MKYLISIVLGLFLMMMGVNKFVGFMPSPEMPEQALLFLQAMGRTGYMIPMIALTELVCGFLLLFRATAPLATLLLAPLSLNIIAFHFFLAPQSMLPGLFVFTMNIALGIMFFDYYRSIFAKLFVERILITSKDVNSAHSHSVRVVNS
jgi:putative oxidoreductase